jgi:hypothetical protein
LGNHTDISDRFQAPGYLPSLLLDWSSDERYALLGLRAPDPHNDGAWRLSYIRVTSIGGVRKYNIGQGETAQFASGGKWIVWIRDSKGKKDLLVADLSGAHRQLISRNVDAFCVAR